MNLIIILPRNKYLTESTRDGILIALQEHPRRLGPCHMAYIKLGSYPHIKKIEVLKQHLHKK